MEKRERTKKRKRMRKRTTRSRGVPRHERLGKPLAKHVDSHHQRMSSEGGHLCMH